MNNNGTNLRRNTGRADAPQGGSCGESRRQFIAQVRSTSNGEIVYLVNDLPIHIWLPIRLAALKLGRSEDTVERRGIPWQAEHAKFKIRYKYLILDEGADAIRAYYEPDLEAMLVTPDERPANSRPRYIPRFVVPKTGRKSFAR